MPRIAIVGSCITRDLWPIHGEGALAYVSRTALPSLLAAPVPGFAPDAEPPGGLHRGEHNALVADLRKTALRRLLDHRPTHIIFDFIDERFDLLAVGATVVTRSAELQRSGYLQQPAFQGAQRIPRLSAACRRLWSSAAAEFAALVRETCLSEAQLILHEARWATQQRDLDGAVSPIVDVDILAGERAEIPEYNDLLQRQEAAFLALMPPMARVSAPAERLADANHRWGLSPFHYVPAYYARIRAQLEALGLAEAFRPSRAAPSVPAA